MSSAYATLVQRLQRVSHLGEAAGHLAWDQETYMPPGGTEARAMELGTLSALSHEIFTAAETGAALARAEKEESDEKHRALLRETRVVYDRATKVPTALVEKMSRATSRALPIWAEARKTSDFKTFQPIFEEIVALKREYAALIDGSRPAYEVLFQDYEPWISLADTRANLSRLRDGLKPLLARAATVPRPKDPFAGREWPVDKQMAFNKQILDKLGYDWDHGRLDLSAHPFSTGNPYDARITTRYSPADPLDGMGSTIHEFGHSLYTQQLPKEDFGTPLGDAQGLIVHESQSRLWENHVGRSLAFHELMLPMFQKEFGGPACSPMESWRASNVVEPSFIRVEADELTYHMHITLRFEVEEAIISGKASVAEIPALWNDRVQKYLGVTPPNDAKGCLQDIHWSHGSFGYFPTYSLGSLFAAQLYETFEKQQGDYASHVRKGEFAPLRAWLKENVHKHGKRYTTGDLIAKSTGRALDPAAFLRYAERKFSSVWGA